MKAPCIALYKAFRGGEWFETSLESVRPHTDGAVVVFSDGPWHEGLTLPENCSEPLLRFRSRHPDYPVVVKTGSFTRHEKQYEVGLHVIREHFGEGAVALVVDTDEVWDGENLQRLRVAVEDHPEVMCFRSRICTYLRSPLYQVYPTEGPHVTVAASVAGDLTVTGRCTIRGPALGLPDVTFHHFCYVRENPEDIREKFFNTSSQESRPSQESWLTEVWPRLPLGENLHMTPGWSHAWGEIKVLSAPPVVLPEFCTPLINQENRRWQAMVEAQSPAEALIPTPNEPDADKYPEFAELDPDVTLLRTRLKMTYLEALILYRIASDVPAGDRILEIGSGSGGSLAVMALASPAALWAIDPFVPYDETNCGPTVHGVREGNEAEFWETARYYGYVKRVRHIKHNSDVAARQCPDAGFDLVFVDGNHSYEIVGQDLPLYWSKVKPGGLLVSHDYTTRFPGVVRAAKEWGVPHSMIAGTSLWYARKLL